MCSYVCDVPMFGYRYIHVPVTSSFTRSHINISSVWDSLIFPFLYIY